MTQRLFFSTLTWVSGSVAALLALLDLLLPAFQVHRSLSIGAMLLFIAISIGLFFASKSTVHSSSKAAFNGVMLGSVFGKMVLALAALFIYQQTTQPPNQWFVAIFLFVYAVYAVLEVWFMTKIARE
jgi:hypothetical protein